MPTVFVSHAGSESDAATAVKRGLEDAGADVIVDTADLKPGESFVHFMNVGMSRADYFLLLWSRAAEQRDWVEQEWQAALAWERAVIDRQVFLLIARIEDYRLPPLLFARVFVDLFPELAPGLTKITGVWQDDRRAKHETGKDVVPPRPPEELAPNRAEPSASEVYVSSRLFDCTVPLPVQLRRPAGTVLDAVLRELGLPTRIAVRDAIGVDFTYALLHRDSVLKRDLTLKEQGVEAGSVLTLEVQAEQFARTEAVAEPSAGVPTYRGSSTYRTGDSTWDLLMAEVRARGLHH